MLGRMDMFAGTGSELQELHVEQNFIRDIEDGTFTQMGKLVELRMFENRCVLRALIWVKE